MDSQWWSWILTLVGVACFFLAGKKIWWAWYVGLAGQITWLAYSLITQQWGFLVGVVLYTFVYTQNSVKWTRERFAEKKPEGPKILDVELHDLVRIRGIVFKFAKMDLELYRYGEAIFRTTDAFQKPANQSKIPPYKKDGSRSL